MLKTMVRLGALSLLTLITAGSLSGVCAAEKSAAPAKAVKAKKAKTSPFRGKVVAVDKIAKSITLAGKEKQRILLVTSQTRIFKAGKPAILDDVVVGDEVRGQSHIIADGKTETLSLFIGAKEGGKPTPKKANNTKNPPAAAK